MSLRHIALRPYGRHVVFGVTTKRGLYMGLHSYLYALCVYIVIIAVLLEYQGRSVLDLTPSRYSLLKGST